jgi:hypothetical protein
MMLRVKSTHVPTDVTPASESEATPSRELRDHSLASADSHERVARTAQFVSPPVAKRAADMLSAEASELEQRALLASKYPTLGALFRDPEAFVDGLRLRFFTQKAVTPNDPYGFDFSDYSTPVLKQIDATLEMALDDNDVARMRPSGDTQERREANGYLRILRSEVKNRLNNGITYRRMVELNYFVSLALGHFQAREYNLRDKAMHVFDNALLSSPQLTIAEQRHRYETREFHALEGLSFDKDLKQHHEPFLRDIFHADEMKMVILPTMEYLELEPLMRLMPTNVFLVGVTGTPIPSDAAVRTSGDFWNHDLRHSSSTYTKLLWYAQRHEMSGEKMRVLRGLAARWMNELRVRSQTSK